MKHLSRLLNLLEYTRSQPQYGYILSKVHKDELSDLAQHHYLVTFTAWQLARSANLAGAKINLERVLELSLIHDLGELFGGDISGPYARINKSARNAAKTFEAVNQKFLSKFFGDDQSYFRKLSAEALNPKTNEGLLMKVADYIEASNFLVYINKGTDLTVKIMLDKPIKWAKQIKDPIAKKYLLEFLQLFVKDLKNPKYLKQTIGEYINER